MKECQWKVGPNHIYEKSEHVNFGVFNLVIKILMRTSLRPEKNAGMLFSADFDRRRMNLMVHIKFWRQACIPALLFGAEL